MDDDSTPRGGCASRPPLRLPGNILLFNLLERETIAALSVGANVWDQRVITGEAFERLGPALEDLVVHVEMRNTTGLFE